MKAVVMPDIGRGYKVAISSDGVNPDNYITRERAEQIAGKATAMLERHQQDGPGLARRDHQATAKSAALAVAPRSGTQRYRVLYSVAVAGRNGRTREELGDALNMSDNTVRPRAKELLDNGYLRVKTYVEDGITKLYVRQTKNGGWAEVLTITEKGRAALA